MPSPTRLLFVPVLIGLAYAVVQLSMEAIGGGVQSHHLLNRADLPAISNGFGLLTLPAIGFALGLRARRQGGFTRSMWTGLVLSFLYGTALATGFEFGAQALMQTLFFGLLVVAVLAPVHRAECVAGFVAGMAFTFGGVLPLLVALVFAAISALVRFAIRAVWRLVRPARTAARAG
ncbi:hypothetical protein [Lysobacter auxotrophicus]|uniref:Uncharacterized protein n=1 Tax=Lysobacter auxotrophicus TaxID=2992573 RepID=A0ABM8DI63_9GAMM|nr:hypothetical protein [Lysobacter auxotrophicus]BDU18346.1 hypothetical protein LA521A_35470 [Lysobacter auxotrophicus]